MLRSFNDEVNPDIATPALLQIDVKNAFNSTSRVGAFDSKTGTASVPYDGGKVQKGDEIPHLSDIWPFFSYFRAIHGPAANLRYLDPLGEVQPILGTKGGQQGDPLEMLSFCLAIHPVWCRVMQRYNTARAVAFADDGYVYDDLQVTLRAFADLKKHFQEDLDLTLNVSKCKLYLKGLTIEEARTRVSDIIRTLGLQGIDDILQQFDNPAADPIQVDGLTCVGVPIGSDEFISTFVHEKATRVIDDVQKLHIVPDSLIHFRLLKFCQSTRCSYLSRCLKPEQLQNAAPQHGLKQVDEAVVNAVLSRGTKDQHLEWAAEVRQWYTFIVQSPHHLGGLGFTPNSAAGIAAFYTSTAHFVQWMGSLENSEFWMGRQLMSQPDTWKADDLLTLVDIHSLLIDKYRCIEGPAPDDEGQHTNHLSLPPINSLATVHAPAEDENLINCASIPPQKRVTKQITSAWPDHDVTPPGSRQEHLKKLHATQEFHPVDNTNSILGPDIPISSDDTGNNNKKAHKLKFTSAAFLSTLSTAGHAGFTGDDWISWFCQFLDSPCLP